MTTLLILTSLPASPAAAAHTRGPGATATLAPEAPGSTPVEAGAPIAASPAQLRAEIPVTPPSGRVAGKPTGLEKASATLREQGVEWYALSRSAAGARVALLSAAGVEIGAFVVRYRADEGRTLVPEWLDSRFTDPRRLTFELWAEVRSGLLERGAPSDPPPGEWKKITAADVTCDYSYLFKSGWMIGGTRSLACERATLDVNEKCSNSACWGCCQLVSCDCACLVGDLTCICTRLGYPCLRSNCEWQIIPDPETCDDPGGTSGGGSSGGGGGGWGDSPSGGGGGGGSPICVDVYCNGSYSGEACGTTTEELVDEAWDICS